MKNKNYKSISEVSEKLKIKQHVIRYWDSQFEGISTRLGERKRRYFSLKNIKKLQTLKNLLHTEGKAHHTLEMARKIIKGNILENKFDLQPEKSHSKINIQELNIVSENLKKTLKQTD